ncbi:hypothetical protein KO361_02390 [Candidatus Woesearchaeota archaeon]|nr:hypothetical protein [Candidatus Woesearchaeota archaeon]
MVFKKSSMFGVSSIILASFMFLLFLSTSTLASEFAMSQNNINFRISPDEFATYNITITNLLETEGRYDVRLSLGDSLNWMSSPSSVLVRPKSTESFVLNIWPKPATPIGVYTLNLILKSQITGESETFQVPVHMSYDGLFFDFVPNVEVILNLPQKYDPRYTARLTVGLKNRNPLNIEDAEIRIISDLFRGQEKINIGPLQEIPPSEFIFQLDPLQAPGEYEVVVQIYYPKTDRVISQDRGTVIVEGYSSTPSRLETSRSALFIVTNTIIVENFGNRDAVAEVTLSAGWLKKLFSKTSPSAEFVVVDGESSFLWTHTLKPTEQKIIIVRTNYWPLVIFLLLVVLAIFMYFNLRSPVVVEKEVVVIDHDKGEGSSDIRIRLFVRSRSGSSVKNLTVIDKVSGITDYVESTQLGHVRPSRVNKTSKKGTLLYWDIEELEPFEERIFTYKVKARLKVVGDLTLPKAKAKFESSNNKERTVLSNPPYFKKTKKQKQEDFF